MPRALLGSASRRTLRKTLNATKRTLQRARSDAARALPCRTLRKTLHAIKRTLQRSWSDETRHYTRPLDGFVEHAVCVFLNWALFERRRGRWCAGPSIGSWINRRNICTKGLFTKIRNSDLSTQLCRNTALFETALTHSLTPTCTRTRTLLFFLTRLLAKIIFTCGIIRSFNFSFHSISYIRSVFRIGGRYLVRAQCDLGRRRVRDQLVV